ncbi:MULTISPECIES: sulfate permease [Cryobacterium]|uniref:sulfate permease n=1 Tax=Cryobacterium TaxID=69578 RepID=UPI001580A61F|nr:MULTISPECIES: sulfate permease [Cryobacterium]
MFGLILGVTARAYYVVRRFMPTNIALAAIHTRRGLKWGLPATLLAVPYTFAMVLCAGLADNSGAGWLNLFALLFAWNSLKFLVAGPATSITLVRVRGREERCRATTAGHFNGGEQERLEEPVFSQSRG